MFPEYLKPAETASYLRVSPQTLRVWRKRGTGPKFVRAGRGIRYHLADIGRWLEGGRA